MMDTARMASFLHSLEPEAEPFFISLRERAEAERVPILRRETESLLRTLLVLKKPQNILEIGTAVAYSTIVMAKTCADARITTIESYEKRIPLARENMERAGVLQRVKLIHGDAGDVLPTLERAHFDFVFLDAAKGQYPVWLPVILSCMRQGAVLLSDNVLQEETLLESRYTIERRERTTHMRMREFLYAIKHDPRLESTVLPLGDGVSISVLR